MPGGAGQLIRLSILWRATLVLLACAGPAAADPRLTHETTLTWQGNAAWFGGFSGIEVLGDGQDLYLITDKGRMVTARMTRIDGTLTGLQDATMRKLRYGNGIGVKGPFSDAEGLAIAADGRIFISFERRHRVAEFDPASGRMTILPTHPDMALFEKNSGFEALAVHPDGRLFALPERSGDRAAPFKLYVLQNGQWRITGQLARRGPFLPVGADFDAMGRLYVLERAATPLGFRSRIRRFDPSRNTADDITLLITPPARFDNLEGIAVWQDPTGETRVTMISDDNFLAIQRTQIVEFILKE